MLSVCQVRLQLVEHLILLEYSLFVCFCFTDSVSLHCHNDLCNCSDKPGIHDFKVLTKLVLPDGYILRARRAGRPTRDCLFIDPVMDGKR